MGDDSNVRDNEETFAHLSPECRTFISRLAMIQKRRLRLLMHLWPVLQYVDDMYTHIDCVNPVLQGQVQLNVQLK